MKKINQENNLIKKELLSENIVQDRIKTTNVNILLNRVRSDRRKILKKKIYISFLLIFLVSSLAVYFII